MYDLIFFKRVLVVTRTMDFESG